MKNHIFIIPFLFLAMSIISCSTTRDEAKRYSATGKDNNKDIASHQNISAKKWGVDLSNVKLGRVYKLNPVVKPTGCAIAGFAVTDTLPKLTQEQRHVLRFALTSESFYNSTSYEPVKTIFAPYIAIKFIGRNKPANYLLISYGGEEWALATNDRIIKKQSFRNKEVLIDLGLSIMPNDEYLESIKK